VVDVVLQHVVHDPAAAGSCTTCWSTTSTTGARSRRSWGATAARHSTS